MKNVTINMNGDTAQSLINEVMTAHMAVVAAKDALQQLTIHQRNYLNKVEPSMWYDLDSRLRRNHMLSLEAVEQWLVECYKNLADQLPG